MRPFRKGKLLNLVSGPWAHKNLFSNSAQWGFHPGGWGKPPLDEYNRPLYGDVFGVLPKASDADVCSDLQHISPVH